MELLNSLNPSQLEAVKTISGNVRIIAGAGSGKTRVLTYRIAYLISEIGVLPQSILAITFTNKAANEMKKRVENILGPYAAGCQISTIHSLCVRILRQHIQVLKYPNSFIIMDEDDQKSVFKKIYKDIMVDSKIISHSSMTKYISRMKHNEVAPDMAALDADTEGARIRALIYKKYVEEQEKGFLLDFDDLLLKTVFILKNFPSILEIWKNKYEYIHVDEFQDIDRSEYDLIKMLSLGHNNTCVVGDPDQTIYSFRGADVNFILSFDQDYENVKTIILNENYRSTKTILNGANSLIKNNNQRVKKDLVSHKEDGNKIIHYSADTEEAEGEFVVDKIEEIISKVDGINYSDFAVLYRANYLSRQIEQKLIQHHIPYKVYGGQKFFNRKEVKDALCYLRLVALNDDLSFKRIINVPGRGIGEKTVDKIEVVASLYGITMYEAICYHSDEINFSSKVRKQIDLFIRHIETAKNSNASMANMYENILSDVGYFEMLRNDEEEQRMENLMELKNSIKAYIENNLEDASLINYLQDISLYTDSNDTEVSETVSLMTIHMAKGLEFPYVFVIGLSEDIFPSIRSLEESGGQGLEEERRLAYVAFTRAMTQLYITDSQGFSYVSNSAKRTSRFVGEVGDNHIESVGKKSRYQELRAIRPIVHASDLIGDNEIKDWRSGDLVRHEAFGDGVVLGVKGDALEIAFKLPHGIKTLMANHKAITRIQR